MYVQYHYIIGYDDDMAMCTGAIYAHWEQFKWFVVARIAWNGIVLVLNVCVVCGYIALSCECLTQHFIKRYVTHIWCPLLLWWQIGVIFGNGFSCTKWNYFVLFKLLSVIFVWNTIFFVIRESALECWWFIHFYFDIFVMKCKLFKDFI